MTSIIADDNERIEVIDSKESADGKFKIEVVQYAELEGATDLATARSLFFVKNSGPRLKFVVITLNNSSATLESGALYYMKGMLEVKSSAGGLGGLAKGIATKMLTDETVIRPQYSGTGTIVLEPSFGHFILTSLEDNQSIIVDKGMYYCSEGTVEVGISGQKTFSAAGFGGEGYWQTKVTGPGVVVLASPVPRSEIVAINLENERLQVDGNFALMRSGNIRFSVKKSTKSLIGSAVSGEGLLQTFEGTGRVWLAPTQAIYARINNPAAMQRMAQSQGSSNTTT